MEGGGRSTNTQEETIRQAREGGCSSMEVGNHLLREGAHSLREGGEPVHQWRQYFSLLH